MSRALSLNWLCFGKCHSALTEAAAGILVGLPALRMTGIYLTIATLAFALIIQEIFNRWESVTGGLKGKAVEKPVILGISFHDDRAFYFLCLAVLIAGLWVTRNVLRAPTGRAWVAIRDSEIAAQSMGVNLAGYKTLAFAFSAAIMGVAGALFAHQVGFLAPDIFTVLLSIQFLLMVVVGGLGSLHGAIFGAVFVALLPVAISEARDLVRPHPGDVFALEQQPALGRVIYPAHQVEDRRLAGAVGADEGKDLAGLDRKADPIDGADAAEMHGEPLRLEQAHRSRSDFI